MKKLMAASIIAAAACAAFAQTPQPQQQQPAGPAVKVEKIAAATAVENREPVGEAVVFPAETSRVYVWTRITAQDTPLKIKHVYYFEGKKVSEVELNVGASPYRVWSYKTVKPGKWKVEITDEAGTVLSELEFSVTSEAAAAPAKP